MAYLGQASLQPYAGHILRMARQCIPGLLLLRGAAPGKSAGLEPQARMASLLYLEFCGGASRAFILMVFEFVLPFLKARLSDLYVSGWYIIGGIIFTMLAYPVGNFVPELVPGARGAAFSGLWIHDAVGLFVTPFAVAIAYYVIPATTRRPIYSHFLSMVGFWVLFFTYPLNGTHHYVYSAIPMAAQKGAIVASAYLGMDVILVVTNLLLSLRGSSGTTSKDVPLRFVWFGVVSYLLVSLQGSIQALMPVNRFIHFTDWVIGHSHWAMIGFGSFMALGGIAHLWQRIPGTRYNERMMNWSFWLLAGGLTLMVIDLTIAGLVEAQVWESSAPWIDSVRAVASYWLVRTLSGLPILTGFVLFWISLVTGPRVSEATTSATSRVAPENNVAFEEVPAVSHDLIPTGWLSYAHVVAFGAGVGFFPNKGAESFMDAKDAPTVTRSRSALSPPMCAASARPPRPGKPNMITRSFGARAASGRICRANSTFVPATGNSPISTIPGSSSALP